MFTDIFIFLCLVITMYGLFSSEFYSSVGGQPRRIASLEGVPEASLTNNSQVAILYPALNILFAN